MFENFLLSGFVFEEKEDFLKFKFKIINSIALIIIVFSLIFALFSDLGINPLGRFHTNVNYLYAFFALVSIMHLRVKKTNHTRAVHILLVASLLTFSSALIFVVQDEFRVIWFYLLVYAAYILAGSTSGVLYTIASLFIILTGNYLFDLQLSELSINSALLGLIIGSLLSLVYTNKITEYHDILYKKNRDLEILSSTDGLTGIFNKRIFDEKLSMLFDNAKEKEQRFSLLLLDLDFFKNINDRYGHTIGDEVLISFTYIVKLMLRKGDTFARIGGEEFAIILHNTNQRDAIRVAQKICQEVARKEIYVTGDKTVNITLSIGVSENDSADSSAKEIFQRADRALYKAKDEGRNKVCV